MQEQSSPARAGGAPEPALAGGRPRGLARCHECPVSHGVAALGTGVVLRTL